MSANERAAKAARRARPSRYGASREPITSVQPLFSITITTIRWRRGAGRLDPGTEWSPHVTAPACPFENAQRQSGSRRTKRRTRRRPVCLPTWRLSRKIGRLDEIPEGGAKSFLRASGDPRTDNRYKVPEGYLWRKQGQPDSEFVVIAVVEDDVVIPITLSTPDGGTTAEVPEFLYADMTIRLHGMAVRPIGQNV